jgi:hypothetical protein
MGQPVSKRHTTAPIAPFENYQVYTGPPQNPPGSYPGDYPPPGNGYGPIGRPVEYGPPSRGDYGPPQGDYGPRPRPIDRPLPRRSDFPLHGRPMGRGPPQMEEDFWEDEDPVYLPEGPRRGPLDGRFDPFAEDLRRYAPPPGGVSRQRGLAGEMIDGMRQQRVAPGRAQQYRNMPPPQPSYPPQHPSQLQPRITKYTTYVSEPKGYPAPPTQNVSYQPQPQQSVTPQVPAGSHVIYYDPATGAVTGSNAPQATQQVAAPAPQATMPQMFGFPQGMQMGFPQGQQGFSWPGMMQQPQQQQPIVIPGSLYTANGGVVPLG